MTYPPAHLRAWRWFTARPWLLVLAITLAGQLFAYQATEAERHDRCVNGRHDTQHALEEIVARLAPNITPARHAEFEDVLHDTLSVKDC